jgi:hypothetical protein
MEISDDLSSQLTTKLTEDRLQWSYRTNNSAFIKLVQNINKQNNNSTHNNKNKPQGGDGT